MGNIPGKSASGFTMKQLFYVSSSGCTGITRYQMGNISSEAYAGFTADCIEQINEVSFGSISKDQVVNWTPSTCNGIISFIHLNEGIKRLQMLNIPGPSSSGFTKNQIS